MYPPYVGHLPLAEKRLKDEAEGNHEFRLFLEVRGVLLSASEGRRLAYVLFAT